MMQRPDSQCSRRNFLHGASALSAGVGVAAVASVVDGALLKLDDVQEHDLGYVPLANSPGMVVVPMDRLTFLTFPGHKRGLLAEAGTVVVALEGCVEHRYRTSQDSFQADHSVDADALQGCKVYEVVGSQWARRTELQQRTSNLRHLIFTFSNKASQEGNRPPNFECLAKDYTVDFHQSKDFNQLLGSMKRANRGIVIG